MKTSICSAYTVQPLPILIVSCIPIPPCKYFLPQATTAATGRAIEDIFREDGEKAFRRLERETLAAVSLRKDQVVSTGGGIVIEKRNRRFMDETGIILCLEARVDTLVFFLPETPESKWAAAHPDMFRAVSAGPEFVYEVQAQAVRRHLSSDRGE